MGKTVKRILILSFAGLILTTLMGNSAAAKESEEDYDAAFIRELEENSTYIPEDFVAKEVKHEQGDDRGDGDALAKYVPDLDSIPTVRNQGGYGTCWAHASTFLAEANMLKKYNSLDAITINYSELALAYFTMHTVVDPLGGTEGDRNYSGNGYDWLDDGGNLIFSSQIYASWTGATDESKAPYSTASSDMTIDPALAYDDEAHLQGYYTINLEKNRDEAKEAILKYGGLGVSYYSEQESYYKAQTHSYYCDTATIPNHAVAIVGWDDDFSKDDFKTTPEGNGAWLIRNSWNNGKTTTYSYRQYFWMSYYDKSLCNAWAFDFESSDNYDNNYQYDGAADSTNTYGIPLVCANVFDAKACEFGEELKAVSFATSCANVDYTVKIYLNPVDRDNPESGTLVATKFGQTTFEGYYTVKLNNPVSLDSSDVFAVVIRLEKEGELVSIKCEDDADYWFSADTAAKAGQSYIKSNGVWTDFGAKNNANLRIKAFTTNKATTVLPTAINISGLDEGKLSLSLGQKHNLSFATVPSEANHQVEYLSSDESVATINEKGRITPVSTGETTITVKSIKNSVSASFVLTVDDSSTEIIIDETNTKWLYYNSEITLLYTLLPENSSLRHEIRWSSSDTSIATVSKDGVVTGTGVGKATITARLRDSVSTFDVTVYGRYITPWYTVSKDSVITATWDDMEEYTGYSFYTIVNGVKIFEDVEVTKENGKCYAVIDSFKNTAEFKTVTLYFKPLPSTSSQSRTLYVGPCGNITWVLDKGTNNKYNKDYYTANDYYFHLYLPTAPAGYEFEDWYTDSKYSVKAESDYYVNGKQPVDYTFYAKWKRIQYNISYFNSGYFDNTGDFVSSYNVEDEFELPDPHIASEYSDRYEFAGWYTDSQFTEPISKISKGTSGRIELYAKMHCWQRSGNIVKEASCVEEGIKEYKCCYSNCEETKRISIPKSTSHSLDYENGVVTKEATCNADGEITYYCKYKADGCQAYDIEAITERPDHSWDDGTVTKDATCAREGEITYKCTVEGCNATDTDVIEKLTTHSLDYENGSVTREATCYQDGEMAYYCVYRADGCEAYDTGAITDRPDHVWDEGEVTQESNCTAHGIKTYRCTNSGCLETKPEELPLNENHSWNEGEVTIPATCMTIGEIKYTCTRTGCDKYYTDELPSSGNHILDAGEVETEATCHSDGVMTYSCTVAGCSYSENLAITERPNHTWDEGEVTKEGNCTKNGVKIYSCTSEGCDASSTETTDKNPEKHDGKQLVVNRREATYEKDGYTGDTICDGCRKVLKKGTAIPKLKAGLTLSIKKATLYTGKENYSQKVIATVKGSSKKVTWKTSNRNIATVTTDGTIKAVGKGTCKVTATANGITATVAVTVKDPSITVLYNKKDVKKLTVKEGKSVTLQIKTDPKKAGISLDKLSAKDRKLVSVKLSNDKLVIKGLKAGKLDLKIKSGGAVKNITVTVSKK